VEAYKWAILAAMNGLKEALTLKDDLRSKMTSGQIEEAQRQARAFLDAREEALNQDSEMHEEIRATATGFLITPSGHILTACHAVHEASRIEVLHQGKTYPATVIIKDEAADVALLKINGANFPCLLVVPSIIAKTGDEVFTIGYPQVVLQGTEAKYTEGTISSLSGPGNNPKYFQISVPIQAGNSGGPLLDERGRAVGMVNARLNDLFALSTSGMLPQNVNYAVKSSFILPFLEGLGDLNAQENVNAKMSAERSAVIERTKQAVVMVLCY